MLDDTIPSTSSISTQSTATLFGYIKRQTRLFKTYIKKKTTKKTSCRHQVSGAGGGDSVPKLPRNMRGNGLSNHYKNGLSIIIYMDRRAFFKAVPAIHLIYLFKYRPANAVPFRPQVHYYSHYETHKSPVVITVKKKKTKTNNNTIRPAYIETLPRAVSTIVSLCRQPQQQ